MLRTIRVGVVLLGAAAWQIGAPLRADDAAEARKLVDKAIQATGGEAKLAKAKALTWREKGTYFGGGESRDYAARYSVFYPGRFRIEVDNFFTMIVNHDKGWLKTSNNTQELPAERMVEQKEDLWADSLTNLLPLLEKDVQLAPAGEKQVDGRATVGVHVTRKGYRDVKVYFDKETGLLARIEQQFIPLEQPAQMVSQETNFSSYKEVDGVKLPTKTVMTRNGSRYIESTQSDYTVSEKLDDTVFGRP